MSLYVDEDKKISWSFFDKILRDGVLKVQSEVSGGVGKAGVSGMGVGLEVAERRFRGSSFGSRSLRFGIDDVSPCNRADWVEDCESMLEKSIYC